MPPGSIRGRGARGGHRTAGCATSAVRTPPVLELSTSRVSTRSSPAPITTFGVSTRSSAHGVVHPSTSTRSALPPHPRVSTRSVLSPTPVPTDTPPPVATQRLTLTRPPAPLPPPVPTQHPAPTPPPAPTQHPAPTFTPDPRFTIPTDGVSTRSTTQTTLPPAYDITDSHSIGDSAQTSSQAPPSATPDLSSGTSLSSRVRGITRGKGTLSAVRSSGKLKVDFDFKSRKAVGPNSSRFNNECGYIYRDKGSFSYSEWRKVPETVRAPLREYLLGIFDIDLDDLDMSRVIDAQFGKAWKNVKSKFHEHFKKMGGREDPEAAKRNPHELLRDRIPDWLFLCDLYSDPKYVQMAEKNVSSRSKRKWAPRNGSVSTPAHHVSRGAPLDGPVGHIETFRRQHYRETTGWLGPDLAEKYAEMMSLRSQHDPEVMSDLDILETVLGRQSTRLTGWGRYPATSVETDSTFGPSDQTSDDVVSLRAELVAAKSQISEMTVEIREMRGELVARGVLPPPPVAPQVPDQTSAPTS